ncbi:MAG: methyltransferase domain-containing protein [Planctomycetota bacterium]|nr:MAG: methyltransferase domain-containing protein [Planctomycetota bacterium]
MPGAELHADFWLSEYISPFDIRAHGIVEVLAGARTRFQDMMIVRSGSAGLGLVLDGKWQSCQIDEHLYHEPLVHAPFVVHGGPRRALVLGGGEGATVREALRWSTIERVTMVDIDGEVVEACRRHLPHMHRGAFDDPRTELVIGDALRFLDDAEPEWDAVISDLSDPVAHGPSAPLFTKEYFEKARAALAPGGVFVVQAGPLDPANIGAHATLASTVRAAFGGATSYWSFVPSYAAPWSFIIGSAKPVEPPDPAETDRTLADRGVSGLRMFDGRAMRGLFDLPKDIREAIARETAVYTLDAPPTFFGSGTGRDA